MLQRQVRQEPCCSPPIESALFVYKWAPRHSLLACPTVRGSPASCAISCLCPARASGGEANMGVMQAVNTVDRGEAWRGRRDAGTVKGHWKGIDTTKLPKAQLFICHILPGATLSQVQVLDGPPSFTSYCVMIKLLNLVKVVELWDSKQVWMKKPNIYPASISPNLYSHSICSVMNTVINNFPDGG